MIRHSRALLGFIVVTFFCTLLVAQTSWPTRPSTNNGPGTCCLDTGLTGCCPGLEQVCINQAGQCKGIGFYASIKPVDKRKYGVCDSRITDLSCISYDEYYCCKSNVYEDTNCTTIMNCILWHYQANGCDTGVAGQKCP